MQISACEQEGCVQTLCAWAYVLLVCVDGQGIQIKLGIPMEDNMVPVKRLDKRQSTESLDGFSLRISINWKRQLCKLISLAVFFGYSSRSTLLLSFSLLLLLALVACNDVIFRKI